MTYQYVTSKLPTDYEHLLGGPPGPEMRNAAPAGPRNGVEIAICEAELQDEIYNEAAADTTDFEELLGGNSLTLESLADTPQWVAWREVVRKGKPTKVPFNPTSPGQGAKANDRSTWGTRAAALKAVAQMDGDAKRGVGLQLGLFDTDDRLRLGGVDLDSCLSPETGELEPWAAEVVSRFASYAEVSPSGAGVKVFFVYSASDAAALTDAMRHPETGKDRHRLAWSRGTHCEIGLDVSNRYYAVTGKRWADSPATFRTVPLVDLRWLIREAGPAFLSDSVDSDAASSEGPTKRDESGSGYGFRFLKDRAALGYAKDRALAELQGDNGKAGEWAARSDKRELARTWTAAKAAADKMRPVDFDGDDFDDLDMDPVTERLNKRHAVVVVRGRTLITTERKDGSIDFGTVRDIHAYYENDRVPAGDGKQEPASRRWMRNPHRRSFEDGVTFAPGGCEPGTLNLWRGWAVKPEADASCALFLDHIRNVICRGDPEHAAYVLGWLAHMVQRPDEKPGVGLVLKGGKGAGKDTVADYVARMIGRRHAPTVAQSEHIVGRFNARLENALLLHVQEGSWAGDHKAEQALKYIVTSDYVEIERKGIDSINVPSVLRLFISANADWVVPASPDERRWAVFDVSGARRGDRDYFNALRAEMDGGGPGALLHFLRTYDLRGFNVRAAPETDGLRDQKIASLRGFDRWWFETLNSGVLPLSFDDDEWGENRILVGRDSVRSAYLEWAKSRRFDGEAIDERQFGRRLREVAPGIEDKRVGGRSTPRCRQYSLPGLPECREAFEQWIGAPVDWEAAQ